MNKSKRPTKTSPRLSLSKLLDENVELRAQLAEAQETLRAIREGEVDALVVSGPKGEQVYSLVGADSVYRLIVETMKEASFTVAFDGTILFCNAQFGGLVKRPMEQIVGHPLHEFVAPDNRVSAVSLLSLSQKQPVKQRLVLQDLQERRVPVHVSTHVLNQPDGPSICIVATDLTELENSMEIIQQLRRQQEALQAANEELAAIEEELRIQNEELAASRMELDRTRARYEDLFETAPDGYLSTDAGGIIQQANQAAVHLFGRTAADLKGSPFSALIPMSERESYLGLLASLNAEKAPPPKWEVELRPLEGPSFWAAVTVATSRDERGHIVGLQWLIRNVTDRKRTEEAREDHLRKMNDLLHVSADVLEAKDIPSLLQQVADAARQLVGGRLATCGHGYLQGTFRVGAASREKSMPPCPSGVAFCIARGGVYLDLIEKQSSIRLTDRQLRGREDWWGLSENHAPLRGLLGARLVGLDGKANGLIMVSDKEGNREFTEEDETILLQLAAVTSLALQHVEARIEAENRAQTVREIAADLARSNKDLEQFAYVASHDLQEPLRMVTSFMSLLRDKYKGQLDNKAQEYIGYSVDGANRMSIMIKDLLEYSRVDVEGKSPSPVDLAAVAEDVKANLRAAIDESNAVITVDPLPTVMADAAQMRQLFQNLIGNAIKFRREGVTSEIHIGAGKGSGVRSQETRSRTLDAESSTEMAERGVARQSVAALSSLPDTRTQNPEPWLFTVRDNGIGIDLTQADRVFKLFQRLHTREEYVGSGIGLAICKKIVERHGGRIWVESEPGKGSTFCFTLGADLK